ncbi:hypothetical protein PIB30_100534, partial [Stylosanthes scabra]|nr:hypothetical protein [Stylosanthes scabra]
SSLNQKERQASLDQESTLTHTKCFQLIHPPSIRRHRSRLLSSISSSSSLRLPPRRPISPVFILFISEIVTEIWNFRCEERIGSYSHVFTEQHHHRPRSVFKPFAEAISEPIPFISNTASLSSSLSSYHNQTYNSLLRRFSSTATELAGTELLYDGLQSSPRLPPCDGDAGRSSPSIPALQAHKFPSSSIRFHTVVPNRIGNFLVSAEELTLGIGSLLPVYF